MKVNGNSLRVGNVVNHLGKLWIVVKTQHVQPGKGGAYLQVELKGLTESTKKNERFRAAEQVERVHLEEKPYQYLYMEGEDLFFMDQETFEQVTLHKDFVGTSVAFLQDNMIVNLSLYNNKVVSLKLPDSVILEVTEAEPVVKGQTAASSYKPAILENGLRVMVPPHITIGMRIVVNTEDISYVERAKS